MNRERKETPLQILLNLHAMLKEAEATIPQVFGVQRGHLREKGVFFTHKITDRPLQTSPNLGIVSPTDFALLF